MQLERQSVEAWQNEKHHSKYYYSLFKYQREPNPKTRNFKPVDHVKYQGQIRSQHLLFVQFSP